VISGKGETMVQGTMAGGDRHRSPHDSLHRVMCDRERRRGKGSNSLSGHPREPSREGKGGPARGIGEAPGSRSR